MNRHCRNRLNAPGAKWTLITSAAIAAALCGTVYGFQSLQSPAALTIKPAVPNTIYVNSTTSVRITVEISDSRVISSGVNLLTVDPITGQSVTSGALNDNGQKGDLVAGDHIFTIVLIPATSFPRLFEYQVSAAFKGLIQRSLSQPITVAVVPAGAALPPDPGPAGMQTLAGIDLDNNGIRDDVERWIATTEPNSIRMRLSFNQAAQAMQQMLLAGADFTTQKDVALSLQDEANAAVCFAGVTGSAESAVADLAQLQTIVLNTRARAQAYLSAESMGAGSSYTLPAIGARTSLCRFNPAALPN